MKRLKDLMLGPPVRTLAVAESMTCGQIQAKVGAISGASDFLLGGVTAYTLEQKVRLLRVDATHAAEVNCVSEQVAREMARGVCQLFGSELGVATTGYAEPVPARGVDAPMAWWAVCHRQNDKPELLFSAKISLPDFERVAMQAEVADVVVIALIEYLQSLEKQNNAHPAAGTTK